MARDVARLAAAGGAGRLGELVFPLPGYQMQPVPTKPPRQTAARGSKLRTRSIAGYEVTLAAGVRYGATRPMAPPPNTPVTISIRELPSSIGDIPALQVTVQNREDADKFLRDSTVAIPATAGYGERIHGTRHCFASEPWTARTAVDQSPVHEISYHIGPLSIYK